MKTNLVKIGGDNFGEENLGQGKCQPGDLSSPKFIRSGIPTVPEAQKLLQQVQIPFTYSVL